LKKNEIGGTFGKFKTEEGCVQGSGGETCFKETLEDLGIDGIIILK
jgi:hypothetical protein